MCASQKPSAKILVVDDEKIVHDSIERILGPEGYELDTALRVAEAEAKLKSGEYDLVLTDLMMPGRDGMELLRLTSEMSRPCGVVIFTGYASVESAVESLKLGALDYLPKPFSPEELISVVERSLEKVSAARREMEMDTAYSEVDKTLGASLDLEETLKSICDGVLEVFKVKGCSVLTYDRISGELKHSASAGLSDAFLSKGPITADNSIPGALESAEPSIINEDQFDSTLQYPAETRAEGIVSIQAIPLVIKNKTVGFMRVYCSDACIYGKTETEYFERFAEHAAQAIVNAMSYNQVIEDVKELKAKLSLRGAKDYVDPK